MDNLLISSRKGLEAWLKATPLNDVDVIAFRAVLRVLPLLCDPVRWRNGQPNSSLMLVVFRVNAASSAARNNSADVSEILAATSATVPVDYAAAASPAAVASLYASFSASNVAAGVAAASDAAVYGSDASDHHLPNNAFWETLSKDCAFLESGGSAAMLLAMPLWNTRPAWFNQSWANAARWLSRPEDGFEIWREWYYGRIEGLPHAFADFDDAADTAFAKVIIGFDDDWWKRAPAEVNADIKALVDGLRRVKKPSDEELAQNPRAFTFSLDADGHTVLDEELLPNGLQGDPDERDNHSEIVRLIDIATIANQGDTNAKDMADPTQLLMDSVGGSIEDLRPRLFILRAREVIRQVEERETGKSMNPQLSERQRDAYLPLVGALKMIAEFSPRLAELWHGKLGQTGTPLTREMLDLVAEALRVSGQTTILAQTMIEASNAQVAPDAPEDDPARIAASETSRNVVRKIGGAIKKADEGVKTADRIIRLADRATAIWSLLKGRLPQDERITSILEWIDKIWRSSP